MATSVIDTPLDDVIKQKRTRGGFGRGQRGRGGGGIKRLSTGKKFGTKNFGSGVVNTDNASLTDLRDRIAKKQKVGDLRQKITTPKTQSLPVNTRGSQSVPVANKRTRPPQLGRTRAMTSGGATTNQRQHPSSGVQLFQLSRDEMKKIQITVPGRNRPMESPPRNSGTGNYRPPPREEPPSRPPPSRSGEQYARRAINDVFQSFSSNVRSRSPSPFGAALEDYRYHRESQMSRYGGSGGTHVSQYSRGLQTGTCLVISNLNSTVSKGDVIELCQAIGPLENVRMTGPGVAEVVFINKEDAMEAYKKYHHRNLDGQPMICKLQMASATSQYDTLRDPYPSRYNTSTRHDTGYVDYDREDYLGRTDFGF